MLSSAVLEVKKSRRGGGVSACLVSLRAHYLFCSCKNEAQINIDFTENL